MTPGLLLIAHGARDPRWAQPFEAVIEQVRQRRPGVAVELAFLDLMSPGVAQAGARLAEGGCTDVALLPLFLGAGGHVRRDLPAWRERLAAAHPAVRWRLEPPVGEWPSLVEAMADAALKLLETLP